MTLEELQVIITANIEQVAPAIRQAQSQFQSLGNAAATASQTAAQKAQTAAQQMQRAVQDANKQAQSAVEQTAKTEQEAQQAGVKAAQDAAKAKMQSIEEIEAIAQRASERAAGVGTTLPNADELLAAQHADAPTSSTMASSIVQNTAVDETPEVDTAPAQSALQRLLGLAQQVRQSVASMFASADTGAVDAASAENLLNSKLDITQQKIEMAVAQLVRLQAEYGRVMAESGADDPAAVKLQTQILNTRSQLVSLRTTANTVQTQIQEMSESEDEASSSTSHLGSSMGGASIQSSQLGNMISRIPAQLFRMIVVYQLAFRGLQSIASYTFSALETNNQFSNSLNNLKVQLLTAFYPIYQAALPAITALVQGLAQAMQYIAAFISGLFGTTYQQSEQGAAALNKNINAMKDAATTAKDQTQATKQQAAYEKEMQSYNDRLTHQQEEYARAVDNAEQRQEKLNAARDAAKSILGIDEINALKSDSSANETVQMPLSTVPLQAPTPPDTNYTMPAATGAGSALENANFGNIKSPIDPKILQQAEDVGKRVASVVKDIVGFIAQNKSWLVPALFGVAAAIAAIAIATGILELVAAPVILVIGIIAGVVVALIVLWNTNKQFRDTVIGIWNGVIQFFQQVGLDLVMFFLDAWSEILAVWNGVVGFFQSVWNGIVTVFTGTGNFFVSTFFNAWTGIRVVWSIVTGFFSSIWNGIVWIFSGAPGWFGGVFSGAWNAISGLWSGVSGWFRGVWNGISGVFGGAGGWFRGVFQDAYNGVTWIWNGITGFFGGIWGSVSGSVRNGINGVIWVLNDFIGAITYPFQIISNIPGFAWAAGIGNLHIPYLATGGITTGATMAMIGEAGQEAVLPLQNNTGWMDTLASRIISKIPSGGTGDTNLTLSVQVGNEVLATKVIKQINRQQKASGKTIIKV